jgi:hypothetical protein
MKEPFITIDQLITQTQILGDMELQAYLNSLNDSQQSDYINSNIQNTINSVKTNKNSKYTDAFNQVIGSDNNITSAAYYLTRSKDLTNLAKSVDDMTLKQLAPSRINNGLSNRQTEINEWANFNKLDTLYFLQVLFISLSLVGILCFLVSNGSINQSLFTFLAYTIAILATLVILLRWRYTRTQRDSRYWHKARFPMQTTPVATTPTCPT